MRMHLNGSQASALSHASFYNVYFHSTTLKDGELSASAVQLEHLLTFASSTKALFRDTLIIDGVIWHCNNATERPS